MPQAHSYETGKPRQGLDKARLSAVAPCSGPAMAMPTVAGSVSLPAVQHMCSLCACSIRSSDTVLWRNC